MEKDDLLKDDFLGKLMREMPPESPSEDFVDRVMESVNAMPETAYEKKSFFWYLRTSWPYAASLAVFLLVFFTSDLPFGNFLPGKEAFTRLIEPFFASFSFLSGSWLIIAAISAVILFAIDRVLSRRRQGHPSFSH